MRWHVSKGMYKRRLQVDTNKPEDLHRLQQKGNLPEVSLGLT